MTTPADLTITLSAETVLGVRVWGVNRQNHLESLFYSQLWPSTPVTAYCASPHDETPPTRNCRCGIYAVSLDAHFTISILCSLDTHTVYALYLDMEPFFGNAAGFVALWGKVVRGDTGVYRAQYAYPAALWTPSYEQYRIRSVASQYGVPLLPIPLSQEMLLAQAAQVRASWVDVPGPRIDQPA